MDRAQEQLSTALGVETARRLNEESAGEIEADCFQRPVSVQPHVEISEGLNALFQLFDRYDVSLASNLHVALSALVCGAENQAQSNDRFVQIAEVQLDVAHEMIQQQNLGTPIVSYPDNGFHTSSNFEACYVCLRNACHALMDQDVDSLRRNLLLASRLAHELFQPVRAGLNLERQNAAAEAVLVLVE